MGGFCGFFFFGGGAIINKGEQNICFIILSFEFEVCVWNILSLHCTLNSNRENLLCLIIYYALCLRKIWKIFSANLK